MSVFDLETSVQRAQKRLQGHEVPAKNRKQRSDHGVSRLDLRIQAILDELLGGHERPPMKEVLGQLRHRCLEIDLRPPSRSSVYNYMRQAPGTSHALAELPEEVRRCLYNQRHDAVVPGRQLTFYCFNYGGTRAISYAASLPWLCLYQAARTPGWRARSRGLIQAVLRVRGIR